MCWVPSTDACLPLCSLLCFFWPRFPSFDPQLYFPRCLSDLGSLTDWALNLAGGEGPPPATHPPVPHPHPVNLLARLEPGAIWNAGLFMEPGGCSPGPDPTNLEVISS